MHRDFVDWLKELLELAKLILVVLYKEVILSNGRLYIALVEREGVLKPNTSFDHKVSAVLSDATVVHEPQDLLGFANHYSLTLLTLEQVNPRVVGLDISDEVIELPY